MPDVKIRKLEDWVVQSYRSTAEHAGHSLEEELRRVLTDTARRRRQETVAQLDALKDRFRREGMKPVDSTPGIRADRETRG